MLLDIQNLRVSAGQIDILKGIYLSIKKGEIHAIMGPNGSGKSTLASVLTGYSGYHITQGQVHYLDQNLLEMTPEQRAHAGLFLSFQYPVEISGLSTISFLRAAVNAIRKARGETELDAVDLLKQVKNQLKLVGLEEDFLYRPVNEGFSGGEKKRNEILQMAILEPKLAILDETDSGLDIDSLKMIATGINELRVSAPQRSMLIITHYKRLLEYIKPDFVHILSQGRIVRSGDASLADEVEKYGYVDLVS